MGPSLLSPGELMLSGPVKADMMTMDIRIIRNTIGALFI
ncbi:hypothetical protein Mpsy_1364 [Methanolobus psychrophilus R15]|nr:hypothetical protein Mpsy_1364 [Methanolobus psychrophilus R15]